jgi:hypothetical protein
VHYTVCFAIFLARALVYSSSACTWNIFVVLRWHGNARMCVWHWGGLSSCLVFADHCDQFYTGDCKTKWLYIVARGRKDDGKKRWEEIDREEKKENLGGGQRFFRSTTVLFYQRYNVGFLRFPPVCLVASVLAKSHPDGSRFEHNSLKKKEKWRTFMRRHFRWPGCV